MQRRASPTWLAVPLLVAACTGPGLETTPAPTAPPTTAPTPTPTFRAPGSDTFAQLIGRVTGHFEPDGSELDSMWGQIFESTEVDGQEPYRPPAGSAPYHTGEVPPVDCARSTTARFWSENAFYCPGDGWVVYDELWLRDFQALHGDFAPAAVLAHEWGHHVQRLLGQAQYDIQDELQADCFAGMYLAYRELPPGATVFTPRTDDFSASLAAFFDLANENYAESSWFQATEHGSRYQRMLAFGTGNLPVTGGLSWCIGYRDFVAGDVATIGAFDFVNLPGRSASEQAAAYVIDPETRTSDTSSEIRLEWLPALPLTDRRATLEQLAAIASERMPGATLLVPGIDLTANVGVGTGWAAYFDTPNDDPHPRNGFLALVAPASDPGGLLIIASGEGHGPADWDAAPTAAELDALGEHLVSIYQVVTRLCGPDHSSEVGDPYWSLACVADV